jgi:hypothetical protein
MTVQAGFPARPLTAGVTVVAIGVAVAGAAVLGLSLLRPVALAFAFGGLVLLIPTFLMRDPKAYWLFLLVLTIPFEVSKHLSNWLVEPPDLVQDFGLPASGTVSVDLFLSDLVLLAMFVPWLAGLSLRRDKFYFPKVAYTFLLYIFIALASSLITATSLYLTIFEWCEEIIYFTGFLYLVNNVTTRTQFRAVVLALFCGLTIASGSVISFFELGIGTETYAYSWLYSKGGEQDSSVKKSSNEESISTGVSHTEASVKRSAGMFSHPAHAAYYMEFILPLALGYLLTTRRARDRLVIGALFAAGCVAVYLTFSRAGLVGLSVGITTLIALAGWLRLISRRSLMWYMVILVAAASVASPLLIYSLSARPESITTRWELIQTALDTISQRPIFGAGLNNSSAVVEGAHTVSTTSKGTQVQVRVVHNHYLIVLIEVGIVGFVLFFGFFWQVAATAFRHMRAAEPEMQLLLAGTVSGLAAIAVHDLADPSGGHPVVGMLWLFTGLIIAGCRRVQASVRCHIRALVRGRDAARPMMTARRFIFLTVVLSILAASGDYSAEYGITGEAGAAESKGTLATPAIQYLLFQSGKAMTPALAGLHDSFATFTNADMETPIDDILTTIGERGDHVHRQLGIMFGPMGFDMTDDQLRLAIDNAFAIAEEKDVAVGFHIDDSMFWYNRKDLWSDRNNIEWSDWSTVVPHRIIGWVLNGRPVLAPPVCYNSPAIKKEATRLARDVIGAEIKKKVDHLNLIRKSYLFAGVIAGWETRLQDDSISPHVDYGYCALHNLGYNASNPPADIDKVLESVVRDWVILWTASLEEAGITRGRIYTHNGTASAEAPSGLPNPLRNFYKDAHPQVTAFNDHSYPGFSVFAGTSRGFSQIHKLLAANNNPPWGISEGTAVGLSDVFNGGLQALMGGGASRLTMEQYLAAAFNHNAIYVNLFAWDKGGDGFSRATTATSSILAYQKFLRGEDLQEATAGATQPASAARSGDGLAEEIKKIQTIAPPWMMAHPDAQSEAGALLQKLDASLKANNVTEAKGAADAILNLIGAK